METKAMKTVEYIKAGAGSGKTYTITERLAEDVKGGVAPENLLATTFTVKAATELKNKLRAKLVADGKLAEAREIDDGLVGTVNGVALRLLTDYAIEAGISPKPRVPVEGGSDADDFGTTAFKKAVGGTLENYLREHGEFAAAVRRLDLEEKSRSENVDSKNVDWQQYVRKVVECVRANALSFDDVENWKEASMGTLDKVFPGTEEIPFDDIAKKAAEFLEFDFQGVGSKKTQGYAKKFHDKRAWNAALELLTGKLVRTDVSRLPQAQELLSEIQNDLSNLLDSKELRADLERVVAGVFECAELCAGVFDDYRRELGLVDFIDQETQLLDLLKVSDGAVGKRLEPRLSKILVDEFQDTNPLQLELFMRLHGLAENGSLWVGDEKQAIYGFRGSDAELMNSVSENVAGKATTRLEHSWRSRENLVRLANAVFTPVFGADAALSIHGKRKDSAKGGEIEAWFCCGTAMEELAEGVAALIHEERGKNPAFRPCDVAVLLRTNKNCEELAKALAKRGVQASAISGKLVEAPECALALAAYRFRLDASDGVAAATVLALAGTYANPEYACPNWLARVVDVEKPLAERLADLPALARLTALGRVYDETPAEILESVIAALGMDVRAQTAPDSVSRKANLDELRRLAYAYAAERADANEAVSPAGFLGYVQNSDACKPASAGTDAVNVMTYHKAKGLEWPIVVLGSLDDCGEERFFGVRVAPAKDFRLDKPLAGRGVTFLPWAFGAKKKIPELSARLAENEAWKTEDEKRIAEQRRLFYVGLTRARDRVIFAVKRTKDEPRHAWLDLLSEKVRWNFPAEEGLCKDWEIGGKKFALTTKIFPKAAEAQEAPATPVADDADYGACEAGKRPLARVSPSSLETAKAPVGARARRLGDAWEPPAGKPAYASANWNRVGDAFHAFFAANPPSARAEAVAARVVEATGTAETLTPATLVAAGKNLNRWLGANFPGGNVVREAPMALRREDGSLLQGFIDLLVETETECVVVDHKTGDPSGAPAAFAAGKAAQLGAYADAVSAATGKPVRLVVHMPLEGLCCEVFRS